MLQIKKEMENNDLLVSLQGRLDTGTAPDLENALKDEMDNVKNLTIDMKELEYISSAGLRVLLSLQKTMNKQGSMVIKNVSEEIMEIFEITGFTDILTIES